MLIQLGIEELPFIQGEAGFFAQTLAKITPPFTAFPAMRGGGYGTQLRNKKAGENAIKNDMYNIFTVRSEGYLQFLVRLTGKTRNIEQHLRSKNGSDYFVRIDEINSNSVKRALQYHDNQQNSRGRTTPFTSNRWGGGGTMWITEEIWDATYQILSDRVGLSKAALAEFAFALGRPRPGRWVARHMGGAFPVSTPRPASVSFTSTAPGLDVAARRLGSVEQFRITAMRTKLNSMIRRQARTAGFAASIL